MDDLPCNGPMIYMNPNYVQGIKEMLVTFKMWGFCASVLLRKGGCDVSRPLMQSFLPSLEKA